MLKFHIATILIESRKPSLNFYRHFIEIQITIRIYKSLIKENVFRNEWSTGVLRQISTRTGTNLPENSSRSLSRSSLCSLRISFIFYSAFQNVLSSNRILSFPATFICSVPLYQFWLREQTITLRKSLKFPGNFLASLIAGKIMENYFWKDTSILHLILEFL